MPRLVIKHPDGKATVHELKGRAPCVTVLGRNDDVNVVLPDPSVSRIHVQVWTEKDEWWVADTKSENGITVRGQPEEKAVLVSGDVVGIGKYRVYFIGDGTDDQFVEGRFIGYLPPHINSSGGDELTFRLTGDEKRRILEANQRMDDAVLHRIGAPGKWSPGGASVTFGREGRVPVKGWFTNGVCAEVAWEPQYSAHVLRRQGSRWLHVSINNDTVSGHARALRPGDTVRVGRSRFRYTL